MSAYWLLERRMSRPPTTNVAAELGDGLQMAANPHRAFRAIVAP